MNRALRVRAVYAELQQSIGEAMAASELLRAASGIVDCLESEEPGAARAEFYTGGLPFEQWGIDRAMADGGWRVMSLEADVVRTLCDGDRDAVSNDIEVQHWLMEHAA